MLVIDSSAVVAVLFGERSARRLIARMSEDDERLMSVATYLETGTVLAGRRTTDRARAIDDLQAFIDEALIGLVAIDEKQARIALHARIAHGRGMGHGGMLNFGDCFSYALAKSLSAPLLYVGNDFANTDIVPALD